VDQSSKTTRQVLTDPKFQTQVSASLTDRHPKANQFPHQPEKYSLQLPSMEPQAWLIQASWVPKTLRAQFTTQATT
jgi:hypothetical protein